MRDADPGAEAAEQENAEEQRVGDPRGPRVAEEGEADAHEEVSHDHERGTVQQPIPQHEERKARREEAGGVPVDVLESAPITTPPLNWTAMIVVCMCLMCM